MTLFHFNKEWLLRPDIVFVFSVWYPASGFCIGCGFFLQPQTSTKHRKSVNRMKTSHVLKDFSSLVEGLKLEKPEFTLELWDF